MNRMLVADDNELSRELVREILSSPDYEIIEARDGGEALDLIERTNPDLALIDIQMPVQDGLSVIRKLRNGSRFSKLPAIALTAFAMRGDREKALRAGFDSYLTKPIRPSLLREHVARHLARRSPDQQRND